MMGVRQINKTNSIIVCCYIFLLTIGISYSSNLSLSSQTFQSQSSSNHRLPLLSLCCKWNYSLINKTCVLINESPKFPPVYDANSFKLIDLKVDHNNFHFIFDNPCEVDKRCLVEEQFKMLNNGSIYIENQPIINQDQYCLVNLNNSVYDVIQCCEFSDDVEIEKDNLKLNTVLIIGLIISLPCYLITFSIYSIIPELNNLHGCTLRSYVCSLFFSYLFLVIIQISDKDINQTACYIFAFCMYFFFLASFYWLNVMCFDIWWTFGGFRALRGSMKQRDRKKFIIYSMYAWGIASFFTSICLIMDYAPNIPESTIRPQLGESRCWFTTNSATNIYFTFPMTISIVCNLCLFISTALKIRQHTKDTAHHLRGSESRRHDDNKQWFNLYMKLFIVMGITWTTEIISTLWEGSGDYIWYISDVINTLQGLIIFITLVCKEKIKRLLLKRFGCSESNVFSRSLTRSVYNSSASRTTCTTTTGLPLQEKIDANIRREAFRLSKESAEDSDCP
ncbi:PREDICTED: G-protein coupled receptor Mth2-like isoform X2 [Polistes dominula]|uniref:G-protein coupled receptor Mth2-like isoform X2 n=1 Tax=Polistes dominula TaxID=743375 RepID=A0ABM1HUE8_POLDO|nr:PREDICTED: G-protein coupled receptor Mth2-like isoform X2 [Polistes dominula]